MAKIIVKNKNIINYALTRNLIVNTVNNTHFVSGNFREIRLISLLNDIDSHLQNYKSVLIAIDGDAAAGKTTLANTINELFNLNVIHLDDFIKVQKPMRQRSKSEIALNVDFARFNEDVTKRYLTNKELVYAPFNFVTHAYESVTRLPYKNSLLVEGAFVLHPKINELPFDFKIVLKVSKQKQISRIKERNGMEALKMFKKFWIFNERQYQQLFEISKSATHLIWS